MLLSQPGKRGRVIEARQGRPSGNEGLLDNVFGGVKVVHQRQCRTERCVLKAVRQLDEGRHIARSRPAHQLVHVKVHRLSPTPLRCQQTAPTFTEK